MNTPLRILLVEDSPDDAQLVMLQLEQDGYEPEVRRVETEDTFTAALDPPPDLILSDFAMPRFNGLRALRILKERTLDVPFILISGTIGEDIAVDAMKQGADDYLMKDRLTRLGPAIQNALNQKRLRQEKALADIALRNSEARYRNIFQTVPVSIWEEDFTEVRAAVDELRARGVTDFRAYVEDHADFVRWAVQMVKVLDVNETTLHLYKIRDKTELLGNLEKFLAPDDFREELIAFAEGKTYYEKETTGYTSDGRPLKLWLTQTFFTDGEGRTVSLVCVNDITERKRTEEALRENEERLQSIFDNEPECVKVLDLNGRLLEMNPAGLAMIDADNLSEAAGQDVANLVVPEHRTAFRDLTRSVSEGKSGTLIFEIEGLKGTHRWLETHAVPLRDHAGSVEAILGITLDITERRRVEEELQKTMELLEEAQRQAKLGSWEYDITTKKITWSQEVYSIFGLEKTYEPSLEGLAKWIHPDDLWVIAPETIEMNTKAGIQEMEYRIIDQSTGEIKHVLGRGRTVKDHEGRPIKNLGSFQDITERKRAEAESTKLQGVIESSLNEIYIFEAQTLKFQYVNGGALHNLGYTLEEMKKFTPLDIKPEFTESSFRDVVRPLLLHEKERIVFETVHRRSDGSIYPVEVFLQLAKTDKEELFLAVINDITERKRTERALRESHDRLLTVLDGLDADIYASDLKTYEILFMNRHMRESFGDNLVGQFCWQVFRGEKGPCPHCTNDRLIDMEGNPAGAVTWEGKNPITGKSYINHDRAIKWVDGRLARLQIATDITERKRVEDALRQSEESYRGLFNSVAEAIYIQDADGRFLDVNEGAVKMYGRPKEFFIGNTPEPLGAPGRNNLAKIAEAIKAAFEGKPQQFEFWGVRSNGEVFPKDVRLYKGTYFGQDVVIALAQDITERKQAEALLREAETKYRTLVEHIPNAVTYMDSLDPSIGTFYVSPQIEEMLGYTVEEWQANPRAWHEHIHPEDRERMLTADAHHDATGEPISQEYRMIARDGHTVWVRDEAVMILDAAGKPQFSQGIMIDISERKQTEERMGIQLERLEALRIIDTAIMGSIDMHVILKTLIGQARKKLEADAAAVLLLDPVTHTLKFAAGEGFKNPGIEQSSLRLGEGLAGWAVQERRSIQVHDLKSAGNRFVRSDPLKGENFISYYGNPLIAKGKVIGIMEIFDRRMTERDRDWHNFFETISGQASIAIDNATLFEDLRRSNIQLQLAYETTIEGWSRALDLRDKETEGHTQRVTAMTLKLAQAVNSDQREMVHIRRGALLHDIGKMGVPDAILFKEGELTEEEWQIMRRHPLFAYEMLSPIDYLRPALDIPYCHHEKWDGTGYPQGLKGTVIPLAARLFAVVDVWDALTSDRSYRRAWTNEKAREYIVAQSGKHFDPQVVEFFLELLSAESME